MFRIPYIVIGVVRSAIIIKRLHNEHNFDVRYDDAGMDNVVELVKAGKDSNKEIIQKMMNTHNVTKEWAPN